MQHSATQLPCPDIEPSLTASELEDFSYIVSHDLASSFRHVSEFSRLLVGELQDGLTEPQAAYAARIVAATTKGQAMLEALLVYSRVQHKRLDRQPDDAAATMRRALLMLAPEMRASGAAVKIAPLGEIQCDPRLLAIALQALMSNAIKFHHPGGRPRITVDLANDAVFWRIRITDNGVGVDVADREKVFRMFHRLDSDDDYPGIGAGLTICRRIARRHGGEVMFLDCTGGARVELSLPHTMAAQ